MIRAWRMSGAPRLVLLGAMALVTAWSAWGWARQEQGGEAPGREAGHQAESEQPAPMNWTEFGEKTPPFLAMLINFALLAGGYYFFGKKPIGALLQGRRDAIAKDIEEAARMRQEAEERAKKYQAKLETLEKEVVMAREALVRAGEAERDRIVTEAEAKADRMRRDTAFLVEQELKQIRLDLWREAVDAAVLAAEKLLVTRVTAEDQSRLAEDFLTGLEIEHREPVGSGARARLGDVP